MSPKKSIEDPDPENAIKCVVIGDGTVGSWFPFFFVK